MGLSHMKVNVVASSGAPFSLLQIRNKRSFDSSSVSHLILLLRRVFQIRLGKSFEQHHLESAKSFDFDAHGTRPYNEGAGDLSLSDAHGA